MALPVFWPRVPLTPGIATSHGSYVVHADWQIQNTCRHIIVWDVCAHAEGFLGMCTDSTGQYNAHTQVTSGICCIWQIPGKAMTYSTYLHALDIWRCCFNSNLPCNTNPYTNPSCNPHSRTPLNPNTGPPCKLNSKFTFNANTHPPFSYASRKIRRCTWIKKNREKCPKGQQTINHKHSKIALRALW